MAITVQPYRDLEPIPVDDPKPHTSGLTVRRLGPADTADLVMDLVTIAPGGRSDRHDHPWPHQVFVVTGTGSVSDGEASVRFRDCDVIVIAGEQTHQFLNDGGRDVLLLCLVPPSAHDHHGRAGQPAGVEQSRRMS